jgi:hypothetical protein
VHAEMRTRNHSHRHTSRRRIDPPHKENRLCALPIPTSLIMPSYATLKPLHFVTICYLVEKHSPV